MSPQQLTEEEIKLIRQRMWQAALFNYRHRLVTSISEAAEVVRQEVDLQAMIPSGC